VEDEGEGQVMDETRRKPSIVVTVELSGELITDAGAGTGVTEDTKPNSARSCAGVEEINRVPCWG